MYIFRNNGAVRCGAVGARGGPYTLCKVFFSIQNAYSIDIIL